MVYNGSLTRFTLFEDAHWWFVEHFDRCHTTLHLCTQCRTFVQNVAPLNKMLHHCTKCRTSVHNVARLYTMSHVCTQCRTFVHNVAPLYTMSHLSTRWISSFHVCRTVASHHPQTHPYSPAEGAGVPSAGVQGAGAGALAIAAPGERRNSPVAIAPDRQAQPVDCR